MRLIYPEVFNLPKILSIEWDGWFNHKVLLEATYYTGSVNWINHKTKTIMGRSYYKNGKVYRAKFGKKI